MITVQIILKKASGDLATEAEAAASLPAIFTVGRIVRFACPVVPFADTEVSDADKEIFGRVVEAFDPETASFSVDLDDSDVQDGYSVRACDLSCPSSEHCCAVFAQTSEGADIPGLGSFNDPLVLPWPVDQDGDVYPPDDEGRPIIPRPSDPDCTIKEIQVEECQSSVIIPEGARPLGVREATGTWGFSIVRFDPETGGVTLSGAVPADTEVFVQFAPCAPSADPDPS